MKRLLGKGIRKALGAVGYELRRKEPAPFVPACTFPQALARLKARGPELVRTVIDVGASDGRWSREVLAAYPAADYLLVEAQGVHEPALKLFCSEQPNARYVLAAAGNREGEIEFDVTDPFGGVASEAPLETNGVRVPVTTIDAQVAKYGLRPPYLIKLDTHGYEQPILAGAAETLASASAIVIECYNFRIAPGCLLFHEMCAYLAERGFRCADLFDVLYRERDQALWQMDLLFLRADRPEFTFNQYN